MNNSHKGFITKLSGDLITNEDVQDISKNDLCAGFDFVGLKTFTSFNIAMDLIAIVNADSLTKNEMTTFSDRLFEISKASKKEPKLGDPTYRQNPNALLCFVFNEGVPEGIVEFIQKNCIAYSFFHYGVVISWVLDLKSCTVQTHKEWVSIFPPVRILTKSVFPGVKYLNGLMGGFN